MSKEVCAIARFELWQGIGGGSFECGEGACGRPPRGDRSCACLSKKAAIGEQLSTLVARGQWAEMPKLISDEMLETFVVIGTWDDIGNKLRQKYDGLLDRIGLYRPYIPGAEDEQWKKLAQQMTR